MVQPWRRGKALVLPSGPFHSALALGLWFRAGKVGDIEDEQWLSPRRLASVTPEQISHWSNGPDVEEEAAAED